MRVASAVLDAGCFRLLMTDRRSLGYLGARRFCRPSIYALRGVVRAQGRDRQAEFGAILCLTVLFLQLIVPSDPGNTLYRPTVFRWYYRKLRVRHEMRGIM